MYTCSHTFDFACAIFCIILVELLIIVGRLLFITCCLVGLSLHAARSDKATTYTTIYDPNSHVTRFCMWNIHEPYSVLFKVYKLSLFLIVSTSFCSFYVCPIGYFFHRKM